jgi:hypothetical protein
VLNIREAAVGDLEEIAQLHSLTIPYSINSAMGINRLMELYLSAIQNKDSIVLIATEDNQVIGFISGTSQFGILAKSAKGSLSMGQVTNLFRKINLFKLLILALDLVRLSRAFSKLGDFYYFSTWGVLPDSHPAAGAALFRELMRRASDSGAQAIVANVGKKNGKVLQMYQSLGFLSVANTISELILKKTINLR